MRKQKEKKIV